MKDRFLNRSIKWESSAIFCLIVVVVGTLCVCPQSRAGQSPAASAMVDDPMSQIHWAAGPQRITLGDFAYIDIPQGYRLTDVLGARKFLESQNDSIPGDMIGILSSTSGNWWAVLEYNTKGYIKDAGAQPIDSAAVLKDVQAKILAKNNVGSAATSVDWDKTPVYDAQANTLAWSLKVQNGSAKAVNQTIALLGRYGVFQITAVQTSTLDKAPSLTELASNISFRDGDRYADYQIGDKVAEIGLAQLIAGEKHTAVAASNVSGGTVMVFVYAALAVGIVAGSVLLLRKKNRQTTAPAPVPVAKAAPAQAQSAAALSSSQPIVDTVSANGTPSPDLVTAKVATNGHATKHLHRSRRKKVFNYPKFYTNVMRELSLHSYGPGTSMNGHKNGRNGHANGTNGHKNGHANGNGHTNGHANGSNGNGSSANESLKSEIVELIATQKNLIQEQKTLLEEQTRLIEQKRWLIEEQTAFLKGQAENQFPLKFE